MPQTYDVASASRFNPCVMALADQIAEAVRNRTTPLSQLLRLMAALDEQGGDERLRHLLRNRIGAPLDA